MNVSARIALAALVATPAAPPAAWAAPPNILVVTVDTLRADRVGAYGYAAARTPAMDRLAREGVLLEDSVVQVPQTRPSHASIFTGRLPYEHGIRDNASPPLKAGTPTLASILRARGYDTAAFIGAYPVSRPSGLDQGFVVYDDPFAGGEALTSRRSAMERRADEVVDAALSWLKRGRTAPFLAWVHLFDPHAPYEPPPPFANASSPYDGEVAYADAAIGRLINWLDASGLRARTLVVVTSDHGEGLGDHGEEEHLFFVYDSTIRVPLILSWPGTLPVGARVAGQFRSIDILPTLLDLAGLSPVPTTGLSRAASLRSGGRVPDNESYTESLYPQLHFGYAPLRALRAEGWKYIDAPRPELYRVADDPGERRSLVELRGPVAAAMKGRLATYERPGSSPPPTLSVDPDAMERLAALGYVGGGAFLPPGAGLGEDPKDKIEEYQAEKRQTTAAIARFHQGDYDAAIRILRALLQPVRRAGGRVAERRSFNVDFYLGRSLLAAGRPAEAVAPLKRALALAPAAAHVYAYLADAHRGAGRLADAELAVRQGLAAAPRNPELLAIHGRILLQKGDLPRARHALERARDIDPADARVRTDLSGALRQAGEVERAVAEAREAVRLDAGSPEAHVALGLALGAAGGEAEAARAFRQALERKADHADALFYLGSVELRAGRVEEAVALLDRLVRKAPDYPRAKEVLALARSGAASPATALPPAGTLRLRLIRVADGAAAADVVRRARAGEDFAALARAVSADPSAPRGGDLGFLAPGDLADPLRAPAARLAPGEVSAVIETAAGFVVLKRER